MYGKWPTVAPIREARFKGKGQSNGLKAGTESVCYCYSQTYGAKPARRSRRAGFEFMSLGKYSVNFCVESRSGLEVGTSRRICRS